MENPLWQLVDAQVSLDEDYLYGEGIFQFVVYKMALQRKESMLLMVITWSSILLPWFSMLMFFLPVYESSRYKFGE